MQLCICLFINLDQSVGSGTNFDTAADRLVLLSCVCCCVQLSPGSHSTEAQVNKQLNDKERVLAALENPSLLEMVNRCLMGPAANGTTAPLDG